MKTYETSAKVEDRGEVRVAGVPFAPGTEVQVTISLSRRSPEEFADAWKRLCSDLRSSPVIEALCDEEIDEEIERHRTGR